MCGFVGDIKYISKYTDKTRMPSSLQQPTFEWKSLAKDRMELLKKKQGLDSSNRYTSYVSYLLRDTLESVNR